MVLPARVHPRPFGASGTNVRSGRLVYEEFNRLLEGPKGYGEQGREGIYDKMRRTDPHIRRSLELLKLPIQSAQWVIEPASSDPVDREIADFVASNLFEDLPWARILRESLLDYDYGFMLFEILTDSVAVSRERYPNLPTVRASGRPRKDEMVPAVRWTAFEPRLPKTVERWVPRQDRPTWLESVVQYLGQDDTSAGGERTIPAEHLLRFTHDQEGGNFAGVSVLRSVYKAWRGLDHLERLDLIRHERQNVGIPVITCPENVDPEELADMETTLEAIGSHEQGYLLLPFGYAFKFDTSGAGDGTNVREAISDLKRDIADNVLAGYMALGNGDTGSYAMADTQQSHQLDFVSVGVKQKEDVWNKGSDGHSPIRRLVDANYGRRLVYPRLCARNVKGRDVAAEIARLVQSGALTSTPAIQQFLERRLELDIPYTPADEGDDGRPTPQKYDDDGNEIAPAPTPEPSKALVPVPVEGDAVADASAASPAKDATPDGTTAKEDQTIFGYHLQYGVAKLGDARKNLNLPADAETDHMTVPEYLKWLDAKFQPARGGATDQPPPEDPDEA